MGEGGGLLDNNFIVCYIFIVNIKKERKMVAKDYTLREKKYAKTKIALTRAFMGRLKSTRFADISIKDVCAGVEVSEGTFYNYFPSKADLICYFKALTLLKIMWEVKRKERESEARELIEHIFDLILKDIEQPFLFYEMVSIFTAERVEPDKASALTEAEKTYAFPGCRGIEKTSVVTLGELFFQIIEKGQKKGELSKGVKVHDVVLSLMAVVVGVPLVIGMDDFGKLKKLYRRQLSLLWEAVEVKGRK